MGFRRGAYKCVCKRGFYLERTLLEEEFVADNIGSAKERSSSSIRRFNCSQCSKGCQSCINEMPCFVQYNVILRSLALGLQSFCATITLVLIVVIFKLRRSKVC
ncbi:putative G-protein coupled receptor 158-like protein [Dinothrombium tinctorium]|uniref:Putative G-protein coupled receptor 158-like protein n=1 Tax=Dinothrombium tinctorium TaxID=1965070 RepID=A0A443RK27_9ACAR|nr:putative G-protein coupled receptor 158-like protein [Dinothrombium tinctorium]